MTSVALVTPLGRVNASELRYHAASNGSPIAKRVSGFHGRVIFFVRPVFFPLPAPSARRPSSTSPPSKACSVITIISSAPWRRAGPGGSQEGCIQKLRDGMSIRNWPFSHRDVALCTM